MESDVDLAVVDAGSKAILDLGRITGAGRTVVAVVSGSATRESALRKLSPSPLPLPFSRCPNSDTNMCDHSKKSHAANVHGAHHLKAQRCIAISCKENLKPDPHHPGKINFGHTWNYYHGSSV